MNLKFHKINGTNGHLNYDVLRKSIEKKLSPTCQEAEAIVLNNFPFSVSSQTSIDFLIIVNIPNYKGNYYRVDLDDGYVNVKNQIMAISVITGYEESEIILDDNQVQIDNSIIDFEDLANKMKWGLTNYLSDGCGLIRDRITVHPVFWIKHSKINISSEGILISGELTYHGLEESIKKHYYFKFAGYAEWSKYYSLFEQNIRSIFDQASKDSVAGYLTLGKIKRIQNRFDNARKKAYDQIGTKLVEVKGKAGTGKSSDLLKWMLRRSLEGHRGILLTYNHLLVYDISSQIQSFINQLSEEQRNSKKPTTVNTLQSFFYQLAKKLGVLLLMSEKRIEELIKTLDERWVVIENYFDLERRKEHGISLAKLKMHVQSKSQMNEGVKREAISFIQYFEHERFLPNKVRLKTLFTEFRESKLKKISVLESSNIFLKDYHKVLSRILQAISDLDGFLEELDVENKYDLLSITMNLKESILDSDGSGRMSLDELKKRYRRGIRGIRSNRIIYIDEAQDCHPLERDIIFQLFDDRNVVVANGGKEQLIRYGELCNWQISQNKKIPYHGYSKQPQSYRMKPAIASLANYIATKFGIELDVEPLETEDHGAILIDRSNSSEKQVDHILRLNKNGQRQGCTSYESILMLNAAESSKDKVSSKENSSITVNEFDNIVFGHEKRKNTWKLLDEASPKISDFRFWSTTGNVDKRDMSVPGALSVRAIYYESCRGIEAWSVMCFALDRFFDQKVSEPDADNYLLNDLFDFLTPKKRAEMYAATWVLMAITRAIDSVYINLSGLDNSLTNVIESYAKSHPDFVTFLD